MSRKKLSLTDLKLISVLILVSLLPLWQWTDFRIPLTHDILLQIQRIASFTQGIKQGSWFPRWGGNLNWGYGHPSPMFLYPLVSYLGAVFSLLGSSYVTATKLVFAVAAVTAAVGMYLFQSRLFKRKAALVGSLLYLLAPYRLVDLNVRASIGESMGLAVLPWVLWRFWELIHQPSQKNIVWAGLSIFFLILAHNAVGLMGLAILFLWLGGMFLKNINLLSTWKQVLISLVLGAGLAGFYLIPGLIEGKYTFQKEFTSFEIYSSRYPAPAELVYSPWGYGPTPEDGRPAGFTVSVGWAQLLVVGLILFLSATKKLSLSKTRETSWVFATVFFLGIFLLLPLSIPVVKFIGIIHRFQFPWRFLALNVISGSILTGVLLSGVKPKLATKLAVVVIVLSVIQARPGLFIQGYFTPDQISPQDSTFTGPVIWTTDTGESTPRWTTRFQDQYPEAPAQVVEGQAEVKMISKNFTEHRLLVDAGEQSQIVDNTLYFPGWTVYVDGQETPIEFQDQNWRGLITFPVPAGVSQVLIRFENTRVRQVAKIISLASFGILVGLLLFRRKR